MSAWVPSASATSFLALTGESPKPSLSDTIGCLEVDPAASCRLKVLCVNWADSRTYEQVVSQLARAPEYSLTLLPAGIGLGRPQPQTSGLLILCNLGLVDQDRCDFGSSYPRQQHRLSLCRSGRPDPCRFQICGLRVPSLCMHLHPDPQVGRCAPVRPSLEDRRQ